MTTQEIADRLIALCREGKFHTALEELYSKDAVSIEAQATPDFAKETKGLEAIFEKGHKWAGMVEETKNIEVSDPVVATNSFALTMRMELVMRQHGPVDMKELCIYTVKDGKIVSEQFIM